jgi:hypothetical protein
MGWPGPERAGAGALAAGLPAVGAAIDVSTEMVAKKMMIEVFINYFSDFFLAKAMPIEINGETEGFFREIKFMLQNAV